MGAPTLGRTRLSSSSSTVAASGCCMDFFIGTPPPPDEPSPRAMTYGFSSVLENNAEDDNGTFLDTRVAWKAWESWFVLRSEIADAANSLRLLNVSLFLFMLLQVDIVLVDLQ